MVAAESTPRPLFVYGSLMRGESNHPELRGATFVRVARSAEAYELVDMGTYPTLVRGGSTAILGELFRAPPEVLATLDRFEAPYVRARIRLANGARADAYMLARVRAASRPRIESGSWRAWLASRAG